MHPIKLVRDVLAFAGVKSPVKAEEAPRSAPFDVTHIRDAVWGGDDPTDPQFYDPTAEAIAGA